MVDLATPEFRSASQAEQRARLLEVALGMLEESGPEGLQARRVTAAVGASTQAIYTLFGGMPGLFEAIVADGFVRLARHVSAVPETDDPVTDFFSQGWAYSDWALSRPQLYRLMFGLTGGRLRLHGRLEMTVSGAVAHFPEGQAAADVMIRSLDRVKAAGRIQQVDTVLAASQFLSATHGYVLLEIGGAFGREGEGRQVIAPLAVNLMVGLGDKREAAMDSLRAAIDTRGEDLSPAERARLEQAPGP